ncbi:3-deoxy-D-manno-octulosonic acid transferase [Candidatus Sumerlaeota bacterium]|nr:3-deoxy-D-manno-octulosonic acid transferase [Candidatus Sumerlaeota bacterium]
MLIYTSVYLAALPIVAPWVAYRMLVRGKYRRSIAGMLGVRKPAMNPGGGRTYWLHAVSVGEVNAASAMITKLREQYPDARIVVSTTTETGQDHARMTLKDRVDDIFYYPVDFPWIVRSTLDRVRPTHLLLMETELWPNMLTVAAARGVKLFMLNGKLSSKSFGNYQRFHWLFREPLAGFSAFCMQTEIDGERMKQLTPHPERVHVTGDCKFDAPMQELSAEEREEVLRGWGVEPERPVILAGSTHSGEDEIVLDAFAQVLLRHPDALLALAPRHPERFDDVYDLMRERGLATLRASDPQHGPVEPQAVLLDRMGVLQKYYGLGRVAIVAGSFVYSERFGGHNLLEAAIHNIPVVYGPHMHKQKEIARLFDERQSGVQTAPEQLGATLVELLSAPEKAKALGQKAYDTFCAHRGSAKRNLEILLKFDSIR